MTEIPEDLSDISRYMSSFLFPNLQVLDQLDEMDDEKNFYLVYKKTFGMSVLEVQLNKYS